MKTSGASKPAASVQSLKLFKWSQIEWLAHLIINTSAVQGALATH